MTLVKWTPKRNVMSLFDDVEQMISQAFNYPLQTENGSLSYSPLMNINEADGEYLVTMDLPGVDKKDVEVNICDGILTISGERKIVNQDSENNRIRCESAHGTFSRSIELSTEIVADKIKAKFKNGVLSITIPKAEEVKPEVRKIVVS